MVRELAHVKLPNIQNLYKKVPQVLDAERTELKIELKERDVALAMDVATILGQSRVPLLASFINDATLHVSHRVVASVVVAKYSLEPQNADASATATFGALVEAAGLNLRMVRCVRTSMLSPRTLGSCAVSRTSSCALLRLFGSFVERCGQEGAAVAGRGSISL